MLGCSLCKYYRILAYNKDNMGTVGGGGVDFARFVF